MSQTVDAEWTLPKGEFAREIGVSAGRVSQMISAGMIGRDALVGEGRSARILVDLAKRQIAERRDPGQSLGNGLATRVEAEVPVGGDVSRSVPLPNDSFDAQFKREKLEAIRRQNRKAAEEEAERQGRFVETDAARQEMTRLAAAMLSSFEGSLQTMATAVASKFGVPQRDVVHLLRAEFRAFRESEAKRFRAEADSLPETVESVMAAEEQAP